VIICYTKPERYSRIDIRGEVLMEVNVGRFEGYLPDKNPKDIILSLLSRARGAEKHKIEPSYLHYFVYNMKKALPDLLADTHFSETSFFPHSEEIDLAMRDLQSAGFIVRPNPKFASFTMKVEKPIDAKWMSEQDKNDIQGFAETLTRNLLNGSGYAGR
jgi:hypothetical protein